MTNRNYVFSAMGEWAQVAVGGSFSVGLRLLRKASKSVDNVCVGATDWRNSTYDHWVHDAFAGGTRQWYALGSVETHKGFYAEALKRTEDETCCGNRWWERMIVGNTDIIDTRALDNGKGDGHFIAEFAHFERDIVEVVREGGFFAYKTGSSIWFGWYRAEFEKDSVLGVDRG